MFYVLLFLERLLNLLRWKVYYRLIANYISVFSLLNFSKIVLLYSKKTCKQVAVSELKNYGRIYY